jgi:hypothetical protein
MTEVEYQALLARRADKDRRVAAAKARKTLEVQLATAYRDAYAAAKQDGMNHRQARDMAWTARESARLTARENDLTVDHFAAAYAKARKAGATRREAHRTGRCAYHSSRDAAIRAGNPEAIEARRVSSAKTNPRRAKVNRAKWSLPKATPFDATDKRCSRCHAIYPRINDGMWARTAATPDGLCLYCLACRQDDATNATARTKAIAKSLVTLFALLPSDAWREQLAREILASNSCQALTWASGDLNSLVVQYSGEDRDVDHAIADALEAAGRMV